MGFYQNRLMRNLLVIGLLVNSAMVMGVVRYELALLDPVYPELPVQTSMVTTSFGGRKVIIAACRDISEQVFFR